MVQAMTAVKVFSPIVCMAVTASGIFIQVHGVPFPHGDCMSQVRSPCAMAPCCLGAPEDGSSHKSTGVHTHGLPSFHGHDEDPLDSYKYRVDWITILPTPHLSNTH